MNNVKTIASLESAKIENLEAIKGGISWTMEDDVVPKSWTMEDDLIPSAR